ncbi:tegument protein [Alcelaphine gammaherpesvirus 1]|uniref:Probable tegument protein antigen 3 n=2 Tax=Alcelaphine gammaherpesvirus 1 TaxID=35252 RepID=VP03_ALHV1|nr:tegument protein [Alcelaphine gammaherpesvirus 1]Q77ZF7.1 RecName: Full=Probable tegument protein antigen 3 [Alcelaphine herpesvirus 1 strain C500]AAC54476.1 putative membrane antigen; similar to p140 (PIR Accession Number S29606), and p160 (Genbank Accession Number Z26584) [Alcelaphine gammaherpesvirus 1]AAC58056.1 tegument protein [Alcelaphine gammaherpesvirus 1]APB09433.1 protein G3 [Alcelaphine gammaherpesvirus 1]APB09505.1 protein G3 [Alcelaphine gammaherpesvirus 1]
MITRELQLLAYTAEPSALETAAIAALRSIPGLQNVIIQTQDAYLVTFFTSPRPLREHQLKIETLLFIKAALRTFDEQQYLPIPLSALSSSFTFVYGPDINRLPTSQSNELTAILQTRDAREKVFNVERIQHCRLLFFSGPGSEQLNHTHYALLREILCGDLTLYQPFRNELFNSSLDFYATIYPPRFLKDKVRHYVHGDINLNITGAASNYNWASPHTAVTDSEIFRIPYTHVVRFIDRWEIRVRVPDVGFHGSRGVRFRQHGGAAYMCSTLNSTTGATGCLQKGMITSFISQPTLGQLGLITEPMCGWGQQELSATAIQMLTKYANTVEAFAKTLNYAGVPLVQGFVTLSPTLREKRAMAFTGSLSITGLPPYILKPPTAETLDAAMERNRQLLLVEVGYPDYGKGKLHNPVNIMNSESGRHAHILHQALRQLMIITPFGKVIHICCDWQYNEKVTMFKIAKACGDLGLSMSARSLPAHTLRLLKKWNFRNLNYNHRIIKNSWLKVDSAAALVVIADNEYQDVSKKMDIALSGWGCPFHILGNLTPNSNTIVISDKNQYGEIVDIQYKMHMPKQPSEGTEDTPLAPDMSNIQLFKNLDVTEDLLLQVLRHPTVGCKAHIVHHVDRCGNGHIAQQPGVGPFDIPLCDFSVTVHNLVDGDIREGMESVPRVWAADWRVARRLIETQYSTPGLDITDATLANNLGLTYHIPSEHQVTVESKKYGNCIGIGEKTTFTQRDPLLGTILAIVESCTNCILGPVENYEEFLIGLSISVPEGIHYRHEVNSIMAMAKDFCSSMNFGFQVNSAENGNCLLRSVVATANAPCVVPGPSLKPYFKKPGSAILRVNLHTEHFLSGGICCMASGIGASETFTPTPSQLRNLLQFMLIVKAENLALSGHDVSDGGLICAVCEMMFAGGLSARLIIHDEDEEPVFPLFSETPGFVLEVNAIDVAAIIARANLYNVECIQIGEVVESDTFTVFHQNTQLLSVPVSRLKHNWTLFSKSVDLLYVKEDQVLPEETSYGNYEVHLTVDPYSIISQSTTRPNVLVHLLPGCGYPDALLAALTNSGFSPDTVVYPGCKYRHNRREDAAPGSPTADDFIAGIVLYGSSNIDSDVGDSTIRQWLNVNRQVINDVRRNLKAKGSFTLAIGQLACRILFATKAIGFDAGSQQTPFLLPNASRRYESRWLNFKIPEDTKAVAFRDLRGCVLPCWVQGTHLGFSHNNITFFGDLETRQQVAATFNGPLVQSGPAREYPLNPTEAEHPYAGLCSEDGRHLALLFDPCLAFNTWQWQHNQTGPGQGELPVSPWKLMFYRLYNWSKFHQHYRSLLRTNLRHTFNFETQQLDFPHADRRGAVPHDNPQYIPMDAMDPSQ